MLNSDRPKRGSLAPNHINRTVVAGNLEEDVESGATPNGTPIARLTILSIKRDKQGAARESHIPALVFGGQAEACVKWLEKGSPVIVDGYLQWPEADRATIIVTDVQFLPRAGNRDNAPSAAVDSAF